MKTVAPVVAFAVMVLFASGCRVGVSAELASGNRQFAAGQFEQALQRYERAESMRPQDPAAFFGAGASLYRLQRYDEAAAAFESATAGPADRVFRAAALHNRGNALAGKGRLEEALEAYRQALRLDDRENTRLNYLVVRSRLGGSARPKPNQHAAADRAGDQQLFDVARQFEAPPRRREARDASARPNSDW